MKPIYILVMCCVCFFHWSTAQDILLGKQQEERRVDKDFSINKLYHKATLASISKKEYKEITRRYKVLHLEKEINEKGEVTKFLFDPTKQVSLTPPKVKQNFGVNEALPNFIVTTTEGKELNLEHLRGKLVLLRFEFFSNDFRFKKNEIVALDKKINALKNKKEIEAIIIFKDSEVEVKQGFTLPDSNFHVVANGINFIEKYGITRFPSTLLIDKEGKVIALYPYSEDIDISSFLKAQNR